ATRFRTNLTQEALDAVLRFDRLARDEVLARNEPFCVTAEIDVGPVAIHALDDAAHEFANTALVRLDDLLALGLANLLHDDLLRRLGRDATEVDGLHRLLDKATD